MTTEPPTLLACLLAARGGLVTDRLLLRLMRCTDERTLVMRVCRLRRAGHDVRRDNAGRGYYLRERVVVRLAA